MSDTQALTVRNEVEYTQEQIDLIKRTFAQGATNDEFQLFMMTAQRMGLRPEARQIHMVKRPSYDPATRGYIDKMTIQTGIDGYRLIADRTGQYAPGREPSYIYDPQGCLFSATAYVKKFVRGEWHEVAATAHYDEYVQRKRDGNATQMWEVKPHIMLSKCAEALALRRAFPAELSGVYTDEEMAQADNPVIVPQPKPAQPAQPAQPEPAIEHIPATERKPVRETDRAAVSALLDALNEARDVAGILGANPTDDQKRAFAAKFRDLITAINTQLTLRELPTITETMVTPAITAAFKAIDAMIDYDREAPTVETQPA